MIKRLFDFICALFGLILLAPLFVLISLYIRIDTPGPIFFRQERVGINGILFRIHKFRTMFLGSSNQGLLTIGSDSRITRSGKFLRKYKIDELPQLIDVIIGNMSFVGPRPEVEEFMNTYPPEIKNKILSVRPGITDMASIMMINENEILSKYSDNKQAYLDIILPIKQEHYLNYISNQNIWLDIKIIFLTIKKIIFN